MAQDFYALFGLGDDKHLSPTDTAGVALAAIQGLYRRLEEKESRIRQQEAEIKQLKAGLSEIEQLNARLSEIEAVLADK